MYTMYKQYILTDLCTKQLHIKGRRPIFIVAELHDSVEVHQQSTGRAITVTDIGYLLIKSRRDDVMTHGIYISQVQPIHPLTVRNYRMLTAINNNKHIKKGSTKN